MTGVKLGEDRPRDIHYKIGGFDVSLIFGWLDAGRAPSGVRVHVAETEEPNNFAQSAGPIEKSWSTFEEAVDESEKFASELINTWPNRKEKSGVEAG
jgi:predicted acyl esterase